MVEDNLDETIRKIAKTDLGSPKNVEISADGSELVSKSSGIWYDNLNLFNRIGNYFRERNLKKTLKGIDRKLYTDPYDEKLLFWKSKILFCLKRYNDSLDVLDDTLDINPKNYSVWREKGYVLYHIGKLDEALAAFDNALDINADDADTLYFRGLSLNSLGRLEDALHDYEKCFELDPKNKYARYLMIDARKDIRKGKK